ncbi:MAG: thioredoxin domain-containing protein [Deltaproteobacteria bacterium]|nr:thioredoxin domain-containing protein [Deltaproteobacteria bacterium]
MLSMSTAPTAFAKTPACKSLKGAKGDAAQKLLAALHPYACCDGTIAECLKAPKVCRLVVRLADNVCRRVDKGQSEKEIRRVLSRRARSMVAAGKRASIDLKDVPPAGDENSPVTLVEVACARCPFCAKITPALHKQVVSGRLKGKVKLYFRSFPIRDHKYSKEAGLGFVAARRMGKFWPFLLHAYEHFDAFSPEKQRPWARFAGMDCKRFAEVMSDDGTRKLLVASKKEGLRNRVKATPTFFIDGQRYVGELKVEELVDVLEEAYERKKGLLFR